MTTYYLQHSFDENRLIIDSEHNTKNELKQTVESDSWIQAKLAFGYPLSTRQERMLK